MISMVEKKVFGNITITIHFFGQKNIFYPYSVDVLYHKNGKINQIGKSYTTKKTWTKIGTWYTFNEEEKLTDSITFEN